MLILRLGSVGDHHIGFLVDQLLENPQIIMGQRQFGLGQIGVDKGLVGAARRLKQAHGRFIDLVNGAVFLHVGAAH
ncbi:hypothetical protein D3C78_1743150 [compost metagenome]